MTINPRIENMKETVKELGIPEYFNGLTDNDIILLGLMHYEKYIKANLEGIKKDMYSQWCEKCKMDVIPEKGAHDALLCPDCGIYFLVD